MLILCTRRQRFELEFLLEIPIGPKEEGQAKDHKDENGKRDAKRFSAARESLLSGNGELQKEKTCRDFRNNQARDDEVGGGKGMDASGAFPREIPQSKRQACSKRENGADAQRKTQGSRFQSKIPEKSSNADMRRSKQAGFEECVAASPGHGVDEKQRDITLSLFGEALKFRGAGAPRADGEWNERSERIERKRKPLRGRRRRNMCLSFPKHRCLAR